MTDVAPPPSSSGASGETADGAGLDPAVAAAVRALLAREDALTRAIAEATRALGDEHGSAAGDAGARSIALKALTEGRDGPSGASALMALHRDAQARGQHALAREAEALLRDRGLEAFPRDAAQAAAEHAADLDGYDVVRVPSDDVPRGEVVRVVARGLRSTRGQSEVATRARLEVSRGPRDPLEGALEDLDAVLGRTPVPAGAPALGVGALREALLRGEALDLAALAASLASADALEDEVVDLTLKDVYRLLVATGVDVVPAPDARTLPAGVARDGLTVVDHAAPAGAIALVRHRGFVRRAAAGRGAEVILAPSVVLSRGPRPALLVVLDRVARADAAPLATLAALAADLVARVDAARDAHARGGASAGATRDALVGASIDLVRALERLGDALGASRADLDAFVQADLLPALAALDPEVEPLPPPGARALDDAALFEVEEVFDQTAPRGTLLAVRRVGLVDRRGGVRRVHPARVVLSRGAKSPLEHALERIVALWPGPRPPRASGRLAEPMAAPERVAELCEELRAVARRQDDAQALGTTADAQPVARAAAALLDAIEPRALAQDATAAELTAVLDGALREGLARLEVEVVTGGAGLSARHSFSPRPAGEILGVARRGLMVGTPPEVVRRGEALVSLGPRGPLLLAADELEALLAGAGPWLAGDAREQLAGRVGLERAVEADLLAGRQALGAGTPRERALALLDLLDRARGASDEARAALDPIVDGPLAAALELEGLRLFPRGQGPLEPALLARADAFAAFEARPSRAPRGQPLEVLAHGVIEARSEAHEVRRQARVVLSLGFDAGFDAAVDEALAALRAADGDALVSKLVPRLESIVNRLRDPRAPVPEVEAIDVLFEALRAASTDAVRDALAHVLEAMGLEVFPRVGASFDGADGAGEVERVFSDDAPAGQVLAVREPGLRRGAAVLRRPAVRVSRGRPSDLQRALGDAVELVRKAGLAATDPVVVALEEAIGSVDALPAAEASSRLVALLAKVEDSRPEGGHVDAARPLARALVARGFRVLPDGEGGRWDDVAKEAGDGAFEPPRKVLCNDPQGAVVAIERRAVIGEAGVVRKGRVRVAAGPPSELSLLAEGLRPGLTGALTGEPLASALAELDEVLERIVNAHAERGYLLALPLANLLQKHDLKDKLGTELKEFMRKQGIKELIAYPNYDANKLGVSKLEEVRVKSDRPKGKIVRVLRPGFERTTDGTVLQKVRAEVSR